MQGLTVDIADLAAVEAGTKQALAHFGKLDILINNAAIVGPNANTWEYPPEAFRDVINVGLIGTFYCCRAVVPHMIAANYGRIVNLSSVAGKEGNPKAPAYSSMKAAVIGFTKSLGKELANYNIAVNCVTPAVAKTTLALSQAPDFLAMIVSKIPRGRMLELDEAAAMICWLASAENSFTTAGVFDLSGGRATYWTMIRLQKSNLRSFPRKRESSGGCKQLDPRFRGDERRSMRPPPMRDRQRRTQRAC